MKRHLKTAIGVALSLALLGWALRDVSPSHVMEEIRGADPLLFLLAILVALGGFVFRAVRWGILLLPVAGAVPFRVRWAATIVGFAANNLLPARVGEFARAFSLSRLTRVPVVASIATLVVERLFDGVVVVLLLFASMAAASFPSGGEVAGVDPREAARVIGVVMAAGIAVLFFMVAAPHRSERLAGAALRRVLPDRLAVRILGALTSFLAGLAVLRQGRLFAASLLLAAAQWLFTGLSFLLAFRAFGIDDVSFAGALFLQSLIGLAVAIPSSPGFFGPFEAAATLGLGLWGVDAAKAVSFAVGYHLGGFIPVSLLGVWYVWRLGLSWREVRHSDEAAEAEAVPPASPAPRSA